MSGPTNTTIVVDYQRARHAATGRRRKVAGNDAGTSGAAEAFVTLLVTGLVLAAVYLDSEAPWAGRGTRRAAAGVEVGMGTAKGPTASPVATARARADGRSGIRR
jgi:hypothetical protein